MLVKLFLLLISTVYAVPLPNHVVQINNVDFIQQRTEKTAMELYKNILIKNLIVTSDNLKLFLNMEHSKNYPNTNEKSFYFPDYDVDDEEERLEEQNWTTDKPDQSGYPGFQNMKIKRQIGGLGGGGGDTQVVLGTFQAMMRPMSTSAGAQKVEVKEDSATQNGEDNGEPEK